MMDETLRKTWPRRSSMTNNFDPSSSSGDNHIRVRAFRNADRARLQLVVTPTKDDQKQLTNKSRLDKSRALTASFGTRRSKIEVTKLESRHLKEENLPSNQTADRLINDANKQGNIITQREVMDNTNASIVRNIPPYDLNAMTLEDVYLMEKSF